MFTEHRFFFQNRVPSVHLTSITSKYWYRLQMSTICRTNVEKKLPHFFLLSLVF